MSAPESFPPKLSEGAGPASTPIAAASAVPVPPSSVPAPNPCRPFLSLEPHATIPVSKQNPVAKFNDNGKFRMGCRYPMRLFFAQAAQRLFLMNHHIVR